MAGGRIFEMVYVLAVRSGPPLGENYTVGHRCENVVPLSLLSEVTGTTWWTGLADEDVQTALDFIEIAMKQGGCRREA